MKSTQLQLDPDRQRHLEDLCRRHGLPVTQQRRAVYEALSRRQDHPTADQLLADVIPGLPGLSRTSIYRILEALVSMGAARKISHPGAQARFDPRVERHHHLTCNRCHATRDLDDPELDRLPLPRTRGFVASDYSVHFGGLCAPCARLMARGQAARPAQSKRSRS